MRNEGMIGVNTVRNQNELTCNMAKNASIKRSNSRLKLHIRNMVCLRCKLVVKDILERFEIKHSYIELGEVRLKIPLTDELRNQIKVELNKSGLELMDDHNSANVEKIKKIIIELVHYSDEIPRIKIPEYLRAKFDIPYTKLSAIFSETLGITIEHYVLVNKIERIKEMILYNEHTFAEIAYILNYTSAGHMSHQFKQFTSMTPSQFKAIKIKRQKIQNLKH